MVKKFFLGFKEWVCINGLFLNNLYQSDEFFLFLGNYKSDFLGKYRVRKQVLFWEGWNLNICVLVKVEIFVI